MKDGLNRWMKRKKIMVKKMGSIMGQGNINGDGSNTKLVA